MSAQNSQENQAIEPRVEIREAPLEGKWANEARNMFNYEWMFDIPPNQMDYLKRRDEVEYWCDFARQLGLVADEERLLLRKLQEFVAKTPLEQRCPCKHNVVLATSEDHWPGCDVIPAIQIEEDEKRMKEKEKVIEQEREMCRRRRIKDSDDAFDISQLWRSELPSYMTTAKLEEIQKAVSGQLFVRRITSKYHLTKRERADDEKEPVDRLGIFMKPNAYYDEDSDD